MFRRIVRSLLGASAAAILMVAIMAEHAWGMCSTP